MPMPEPPPKVKRGGHKKEHKLGSHAASLVGGGEHVVYTEAEIRQKLLEAQSAAVDWFHDLTVTRTASGIGAAQMALQRANAELDRLDEKAATANGQRVNLTINNVDISRLAFGSNLRKAARDDTPFGTGPK